MTRTPSILLAAIALLSITHSVLASPKAFSLPFEKHVGANVSPLQRRQNYREIPVGNAQVLYYINVTIGTPPQRFTLQLDTGSSDTWIPSVSADICNKDFSLACLGGVFDADASRTFVELPENPFQIRYLDGSQVQGDYFADTIQIGDSFQLKNLTMALATTTSRGLGIMGLGYQEGESIILLDPTATYPNVIDELVAQGITNSRAYSLYLNDVDATSGNILFGGVDTSKYSGDLIGLPISQHFDPDELRSFIVAFTGLTVVDDSGNNLLIREGLTLPAFIDSGATNTYLPDSIANDIFQGIGVMADPQFGNLVRCRLGREEATFKFGFGGDGGPMIEVPLSQLVMPILTFDGSTPSFDDGEEACTFGISSIDGGLALFGDSFMRAAYVVYDLQNDLIALAQARYDSSEPGVKEFSTEGTIPNLVNIASAVQVTLSATSVAISEPATGTPTGTRVVGTQPSPTFQLGGDSTSDNDDGSESTGGEGSESDSGALATFIPVVQASIMVACVLVFTSTVLCDGVLGYM